VLDETRLLLTLQRYYLGGLSFEKVARDAGITLQELIDYVRDKDLRVILTDRDRVEGLKKVSYLMEQRGMKSAVKIAHEAYQKARIRESP